MKPISYESPLTTTRELLAEYLNPLFVISQEVGESSRAARAYSTDYDPELRSVRPRLA